MLPPEPVYPGLPPAKELDERAGPAVLVRPTSVHGRVASAADPEQPRRRGRHGRPPPRPGAGAGPDRTATWGPASRPTRPAAGHRRGGRARPRATSARCVCCVRCVDIPAKRAVARSAVSARPASVRRPLADSTASPHTTASRGSSGRPQGAPGTREADAGFDSGEENSAVLSDAPDGRQRRWQPRIFRHDAARNRDGCRRRWPSRTTKPCAWSSLHFFSARVGKPRNDSRVKFSEGTTTSSESLGSHLTIGA